MLLQKPHGINIVSSSKLFLNSGIQFSANINTFGYLMPIGFETTTSPH
jgi:hypothetical protein